MAVAVGPDTTVLATVTFEGVFTVVQTLAVAVPPPTMVAVTPLVRPVPPPASLLASQSRLAAVLVPALTAYGTETV